MIFLMDENFPSAAWQPLSHYFRSKHEFIRVGVSFPRGMADVDLFSHAAERGYDAVITADIKQINSQDRRQERIACRDAGLHWIGVPSDPKARGKAISHGQISQLLGSMKFVGSTLEQATAPTAILLGSGNHTSPCQRGFPQDL